MFCVDLGGDTAWTQAKARCPRHLRDTQFPTGATQVKKAND